MIEQCATAGVRANENNASMVRQVIVFSLFLLGVLGCRQLLFLRLVLRPFDFDWWPFGQRQFLVAEERCPTADAEVR